MTAETPGTLEHSAASVEAEAAADGGAAAESAAPASAGDSGPVGLDQPDFPIEFADPSHVELTWEWDDMHMPFAFAPLAADYSLSIGQAFSEPYRRYPEFGPFPQEWFAASWNGYTYYAVRRNYAQEERAGMLERITALSRSRIEPTAAYWRDELVPELRQLYQGMRDVPVEEPSLSDVADGWDAGWAALERGWRIHFDIICGPYQVMEDLADLYEKASPDAPSGEAVRLIGGRRHELFDVEVAIERLAALAPDSPALATALGGGTRSIDELRSQPGGAEFAAAFEAFLEEHGHLGQSVDDLALASWGEEPANLLAEIAKRLEHTPEPAEGRRARLAAEADELADGVRTRLAAEPEELARFEVLLRQAREIGFMTETHNYWIDRRAQAEIRRLATRIGRRMVGEGLLAAPEDILYLHRDEIGPALRDRTDQRALVAERRAEHERQRTLTPPHIVGKAPPPPVGRDRFEADAVEASDDASLLRGTGASAGTATGPARVVLTSNEFDRIRPGDIIVCPSSNPSWVPVFTIAGGLVTNTGGVLSHAAVVAREFGLPAVTGVANATTTIRDGQTLEIDGTTGTVRLL
jgi:phosphohistidine swiveling domain-containing protein